MLKSLRGRLQAWHALILLAVIVGFGAVVLALADRARLDAFDGALATLAWQLGLTGLGVFALGLAGGWWLARKLVAPLEAISATAASISAANLCQRIETAGMDDELGQLGTILNAMFERLEAAFKQQVRFTADASHELRTPLSIIFSHLELALTRPRTAEEYRETLETCRRAAQRMKALVEDLLTLARADAGRLDLKKSRLDLYQIANECIELLEPLARQRNIRLSLLGCAAPVDGDGHQLARVATNLVNNALLYNRPGGKVILKTTVVGKECVLTVADTGVGIPEKDVPRVFDRFYRVDKSRSRDTGGCGLGLAICKSIVDSHGGTITITSEVGVGTTFHIRLQLAQDDIKPAGDSRPIKAPAHTAG